MGFEDALRNYAVTHHIFVGCLLDGGGYEGGVRGKLVPRTCMYSCTWTMCIGCMQQSCGFKAILEGAG